MLGFTTDDAAADTGAGTADNEVKVLGFEQLPETGGSRSGYYASVITLAALLITLVLRGFSAVRTES